MNQESSSYEGAMSRAESELDSFARDIRDFLSLPRESQEKLAKQYFLASAFDKLYELLDEVKGLNLTQMVDKKKYTLVHSLVLNQGLSDLKFVIEYAKKSFQSQPNFQDIIAEWINSPSEGGFTALHYSSYRGDVGMSNYLMQNGANCRAKNSKGLNVMHIAAQNDQPISLRFFQIQGLNPSEMEYKQGNAMHWASFLGSENAILYLTSYSDIDINQPDEQGLSPLHLAVISGNARAVKRLLIKGADRDAKDEKGNTPGELAAQEGYENIQAMIETEGGLEEYCNLKQPFKPLNKNLKQVMIFFGLFFGVQLLFAGFIAPCLNEGYIQIGIWIGLSFLSLILHLIAWLRDAGEVSNIKSFPNSKKSKKKQNQESSISSTSSNHAIPNPVKLKDSNTGSSIVTFEKLQYKQLHEQEPVFQDDLLMLLQLYPIDQICIECQILKPPRSKHCEICKKCIRVYDHHCPWINNCVGTKNYLAFILFIIVLWFTKLAAIALTLIHIQDSFQQNQKEWHFNWYYNLSEDTLHTLFIVKLVAQSIILIIAVPFFIMLSALVFVQINNLFRNMTTFERFSKKIKKEGIDDSTLSTIKDINGFDEMNDQENQALANQRKKKSNPNKSNTCSLKSAFKMCCANQKEAAYNFDKQEFLAKVSLYIQQQGLDGSQQ